MNSNPLSKTIKITSVIVLILLLVLFIIFSFRILLLILGGVLIALIFNGISNGIKKLMPKLKKSIITSIVITISFISISFLLYLLYPRVAEQVLDLKVELPEAINQVKEKVKSNEALSFIADAINQTTKNKDFTKNIKFFFNSIFGFFGDFYIIIILGLFFSMEPSVYVKGITVLFPLEKRSAVSKHINKIGTILQRWLVGKILSMLIVGVFTGIGLYLLKIPLALSLAIIATLSAFIPNIGPIIALIPALLIAFVKGEEYVLYVFVLYTGIQILESNIITPLIQREAISFPMALILIAQIVLGIFTGYLGLILATPVMAILLFLIKEIYIKGYIEKKEKALID
ncbi:AI-2E family transporter [uncultured Tenacibaculum sp.]|uniref:AI-2E family transporter n=1 Tax=uncultured Tenacibaculum sp. TaxID=174713 RepID=UPI00260DF788|nr:AI-2E family transporter [uncultured Tenacibaculum sp.]